MDTAEKTGNKTKETTKLTEREFYRFLKFVLFSISAGIIEIVTYTLLYIFTDWQYWPCYLIALIISVLWNFTLNREFTFRSANNVPLAMLKIAAFYAVFTPLSTIWGHDLVDNIGLNGHLVTIGSMLVNFITEYLYDRFIVFRGSLDTNNWAHKHLGHGIGLSGYQEGLTESYPGYFLGEEDMEEIINCHEDAYSDYPMYPALFGKYDSLKVRKVFWNLLMRTYENTGIYIADSSKVNCMALLQPAGYHGGSIMSYARYGGLKLPIGLYGKLIRFENYTLKIKERHCEPNCWYLIDGIIRHDSRGTDLPRKMYEPMFEYLDSKGAGCYVEVHTKEMVEMYEGYGFELVETGKVPGSDQLHYAMYRKAKSN